MGNFHESGILHFVWFVIIGVCACARLAWFIKERLVNSIRPTTAIDIATAVSTFPPHHHRWRQRQQHHHRTLMGRTFSIRHSATLPAIQPTAAQCARLSESSRALTNTCESLSLASLTGVSLPLNAGCFDLHLLLSQKVVYFLFLLLIGAHATVTNLLD